MRCQSMQFMHWHSVLIFLIFSLATVVGKPGFLLTTHNTAIPGSRHNVCITFTGVTSEMSVEYEFRRPEVSSFSNIYAGRIEVLPATGGCREFALPVTLPTGLLELRVIGYSTDVDAERYDFNGSTTLKVISTVPDFTIIQTDKPVYKPGQTVRFRLVTLMFNLSVVTTGDLNVSIKNPDGIDIERWESIPRSKGIVQLSLKLADEPRLGTYSIHCDAGGRVDQKNFTVKHYVLPRVEVLHKPAEYFFRGSEALTGHVCARYMFSGGVNLPALKGLVAIKFAMVKVGNDSRITEKVNHNFTHAAEINGCYTYNILAENLQINWVLAANYNYSILVTVNVVEHGTGIKTTAKDALIKLESDSGVLKIFGDDTYKPGLPYRFKVKLSFRNGQSHSDKGIAIEITNGNSPEFRSTNMTDLDGFAFFTATLASLFQELTIEAKFTDTESIVIDKKQITSWYSPTGRYIKIRQPNDGNAISCKKQETIEFDYTTRSEGEAVRLNYQVIGKSNILLSQSADMTFVPAIQTSQPRVQILAESCSREANISIATRSNSGSDSVTIMTVPEMYPSAKLIVFYIAPDGEIIADWTEIRVKECTRNPVRLSFSREIVRPGRNISLEISAAAGSFCAYGVIDRSIDLISTGKLLDLAEVVETAQARLPINDNWQTKINDYMSYKGKCEETMPSGNSNSMNLLSVNDSRIAFLIGKMAVATDAQLDTRKCFCSFQAVSSQGLRLNSAPEWEYELSPDGVTYEPSALIRDYFPETWLWDGVVISQSGRTPIAVNAPHSLTSWRGKAMCVHSELGFGISSVSQLTTLQRFFMRVSLPYSVIRGESVPVIVKIHNYYTECFTITAIIEDSIHYEIGDGTAIRCVCGAHPEILIFRIIPRSIGTINVTITAREANLDGDANVCPPNANMSIIVGIRDTVIESLLVEPEGKREEHVQSAYICGRAGETPKEWKLSMALPDNIVADSARGSISVVGDLLGVTLANIKNLIVLPEGCGEQSMSAFAPISFAARYLEATGQLTVNLRNEVTEFVKTGYQKQLRTWNKDGSFSYYNHIFYHVPSLWLTAFITKCFTYASRYLPVAKDNIGSSVRYIREQQLPDGCFSAVAAGVYTKFAPALDGPSNEKLKIRVTAFVAIAMLESGVSPQDTMIERAMLCLDRGSEDLYGLAMTAYAFSLHDVRLRRRQVAMKELMRRATSVGSSNFRTAGKTMHWVADPFQNINAPINIETTAYALLAILAETGQTVTALPVVNWLTQLQNSRGGFGSTQDTVVTIQALAAYAEATYSTNRYTDLVVNASIFEFSRSFEVTTRNRLVLQSAEFSKLRPGNLTFVIAGGGCVVVQAKAIYNVMIERTPKAYFQTLVKPYFKEAAQMGDNCTQRLIQICTRYTGEQDDSSAMAIIDIRMISGWAPDIASLDNLVENNTLELMRYELKNQVLSLHFTQIVREYRCLTIEATRDYSVRNAKPGQVFTYEYYAPARRYETTFSLEECIEDEKNITLQEQLDEPDCPDDEENCASTDNDVCPTCAQPRRLSKLCQFKHVLKVRLRSGKSGITIVDDLKAANSYLKNRAATFTMPSCLCETLEIDDSSTQFIVAYTRELARRSRSTVINLDSQDIYVFTATRSIEEKITQALRGCTA